MNSMDYDDMKCSKIVILILAVLAGPIIKTAFLAVLILYKIFFT